MRMVLGPTGIVLLLSVARKPAVKAATPSPSKEPD